MNKIQLSGKTVDMCLKLQYLLLVLIQKGINKAVFLIQKYLKHVS